MPATHSYSATNRSGQVEPLWLKHIIVQIPISLGPGCSRRSLTAGIFFVSNSFVKSSSISILLYLCLVWDTPLLLDLLSTSADNQWKNRIARGYDNPDQAGDQYVTVPSA